MASETFNEIMALLSSSKERFGTILKEVGDLDLELEKMRYQVSELETELFAIQDFGLPRCRELRIKIEDLMKNIGSKIIKKLGILNDARCANKNLFLRAREKANNLRLQLDEENPNSSRTIEQRVNKTILREEESYNELDFRNADKVNKENYARDKSNYNALLPTPRIKDIKENTRNTNYTYSGNQTEKIRKTSSNITNRPPELVKRTNSSSVNREMPPAQSIYSSEKSLSQKVYISKSNESKKMNDIPIVKVEEKKSTPQNLPKAGRGDVFCLCLQPSYGEMIYCEGKKCPVGWYHIGCINLKEVPEGDWLCAKCTNATLRN